MRYEQIIAMSAQPMAVCPEFLGAVDAAVLMLRGGDGSPARHAASLGAFGAPMSLLAASSSSNAKVSVEKNTRAISAAFENLYTRVPTGAPDAAGRQQSVAVVDVWGPLMASDSEVSNSEGNRWGTSYAFIKQAVLTARADPSVDAIMIRYDSPGGAAIGMHPASAELFDLAHGDGAAGSGLVGTDARGVRKPIVAYAERLMASAALGLGVQASAVLVAPAAITGSIGTISYLPNYSAMLDRIGIKVEAIKNPDHKDAGSPYRVMSTDDRARLQGTIDTLSGMFRADVARGRRVDAAKVGEWVQQMTFVGRQAVNAGLADGMVVNAEQAIRAAAALAVKTRR